MKDFNFHISLHQKRWLQFLFFCLLIVCFTATRANNTPQQTIDSLFKQVESISFSERTNAALLLSELQQIADQQPDNNGLRQGVIYRKAAFSYAQGLLDSTLTTLIDKEISSINKEQEPRQYALMQYSKALTLINTGYYDEAFTGTLHAMEFFKQANDSILTSKTLNTLGRICSFIKSYNMAENYYTRALTFCKPSGQEYYRIRSNIYFVWARNNRSEEAIDSLLSLVPVLEQKKHFDMLATNYQNIGVFYSNIKESGKALHYYLLAENFNQYIDNTRFTISLCLNLGSYYMNIKSFNNAHRYFKEANDLADQSGSPDLIALSLRALSYIYEREHNIDSAYYYLNEYYIVKSKITDNTNPIEAYQSYINVFLEASQKELVIKEQEILLKNRRFAMFASIAVAIILFIVLCMIILYQQKRHVRQQNLLKEAENKELEERLHSKQLIEHLQEERIETQKREIISYTMLLTNKDNILQQIADEAKHLSIRKKEVRAIHQIIKNNLNTDRSWEDFMLHFEKVHPDFFNKMASMSSDLSQNDTQLCAYFRIGLSTKQIAQILNVSSDSIKMHRYRMKKKLNLSEDQSLDDFIRNI